MSRTFDFEIVLSCWIICFLSRLQTVRMLETMFRSFLSSDNKKILLSFLIIIKFIVCFAQLRDFQLSLNLPVRNYALEALIDGAWPMNQVLPRLFYLANSSTVSSLQFSDWPTTQTNITKMCFLFHSLILQDVLKFQDKRRGKVAPFNRCYSTLSEQMTISRHFTFKFTTSNIFREFVSRTQGSGANYYDYCHYPQLGTNITSWLVQIVIRTWLRCW